MPPTLKDSSTPLASSDNPERASEKSASGTATSSAQPVALEVPVTVNGARAVEGSGKREPFSEATSTVLVLAGGAVIRLSSSVAPGQLLFLTNDKTKKEVVCQVVKSKSYRSASGYVELEFTEPVLGFWGMRFPGDRSTAAGGLGAARKSDASAAINPPRSPEPKAVTYADQTQAVESVTSNLTDAVQEFKPDIKADSRPSSRADFLAPSETSTDGLKPEANRLNEQLSALLFSEQKQSEVKGSVPAPSQQELGDTATKILEIVNEEPTTPTLLKPKLPEPKLPVVAAEVTLDGGDTPPQVPQAATSIFDAEEVKIPAWLEPLTRNASVHAASEEALANHSTEDADDWQGPTELDSASAQETAATSTVKKPSSAPKSRPSAAVFGNSLLGEVTASQSQSCGGGKGIWLPIAAGVILAAAGGAWYFRDSLGLGTETSSLHSVASTTALPSSAVVPVNTDQNFGVATSPNPNVTPSGPEVISSPKQGKVQSASITERIPKANSADVITPSETSVEVIEPEAKKPSLGKVRLAKPKVGRSQSALANSIVEPTIELSGDGVPTGESSLGTNLANMGAQPTAPTMPVALGGDVKPAHILSSVAPVYPALARAQHVSGNVRVDALVDASGRVTTMKVVSGPSLLHQAAMDALRQWKYQAATLDGKPVPMHLTVAIQFRLQ